MKANVVSKINRIPQIVGFSIFTVVALIFLALFLTLFDGKIPENYVRVDATIESISRELSAGYYDDQYDYDVRIEYSYGGQTFNDVEYNKYSSSMKIGNTVTIYVNPDAPSEYMSDPSDNFIFPLICGVFAAVGLALVVINIKKLKEETENVQ